MLFIWEMSTGFESGVLDLILTFAISKETRLRRGQQLLQRDQKGGWCSSEGEREWWLELGDSHGNGEC